MKDTCEVVEACGSVVQAAVPAVTEVFSIVEKCRELDLRERELRSRHELRKNELALEKSKINKQYEILKDAIIEQRKKIDARVKGLDCRTRQFEKNQESIRRTLDVLLKRILESELRPETMKMLLDYHKDLMGKLLRSEDAFSEAVHKVAGESMLELNGGDPNLIDNQS